MSTSTLIARYGSRLIIEISHPFPSNWSSQKRFLHLPFFLSKRPASKVCFYLQRYFPLLDGERFLSLSLNVSCDRQDLFNFRHNCWEMFNILHPNEGKIMKSRTAVLNPMERLMRSKNWRSTPRCCRIATIDCESGERSGCSMERQEQKSELGNPSRHLMEKTRANFRSKASHEFKRLQWHAVELEISTSPQMSQQLRSPSRQFRPQSTAVTLKLKNERLDKSNSPRFVQT